MAKTFSDKHLNYKKERYPADSRQEREMNAISTRLPPKLKPKETMLRRKWDRAEGE